MNEAANENNQNYRINRLPLYLTVGILITGISLYFLVPQTQEFMNDALNVLTSGNTKKIKGWFENFGWIAPIVLVLAMVAQMFLIVIPTIVLMIVSILAYGPLWGSAIILISVFAASSVGYWIGRSLDGAIVEKIIGRKTKNKVSNFMNKYGFWAIFITRLNPFLSNDAISFVGGLLKVHYWKFIGASLAGIFPLTVFLAIIGKSTESIEIGLLWGSVFSLILFIAYVIWDKKQTKTKKRTI